jgi:hypothetical protein
LKLVSSNNGSRFSHQDYNRVREVKRNKKKKKRSVLRRVFISLFLVLLLAGFGFAAFLYWWAEYARFEYALQPIVVLEGQPVSANDFNYPSVNIDRITTSFTNPGFRPGTGAQAVSLTLSLGRRTLETRANLYVLTTVSRITHEFRESLPELDPMDFISNANTAAGVAFDVRFVEKPMLLEEYDVGEHTLYLTLNNAPFEVLLEVVDTTPPTAEAETVVLYAGETAEPSRFVSNPYDASGIKSIEFINIPNFLSDRNQLVEIEIIDNNGNSSSFMSELIVILNKEDPVIEGTTTIISRVNEPIIYRAGVTAFDDMGRELEVSVDSSGVDQFTVGEYTVIYYAIDATGNRTEVVETIFIIDVDIEAIYEEVDGVLGSILRENMSQREKVTAIHRWIRNHIGWAARRGGPPTVYEAAYRALRDRSGNCFNYYALSEVMLTRAGIPNMLIERIPGTPTRHRWNLVNPDGLGWHHFDSVPAGLNLGDRAAFFTDSQARAFAERIRIERGRADYFTYNPELYPEIVD